MSDRQLLSKLRCAINLGDLTTIRRLLKGGVDVNVKFWYGSTLLHDAVSMLNVDLVEVLLRAGADVNSPNKGGRIPLHLACRAGALKIVQMLIAAGSNVNRRTVDGRTCLHVTIWRDYEKVVEELLKAGADPNIPDSEGCTPLQFATQYKCFSTMQVLVEAGARVNYTVKGRSPLLQALEQGNIKIVRFLLLHGAETNIMGMGKNKSAVSLLMEGPIVIQELRERTLDMLVQAGYKLHKDPWVPSDSSPSSSTSRAPPCRRDEKQATESPAQLMEKFLKTKRGVIPKLACLCRTRIRKRLSYCNRGRSIVDKVSRLPLPSIIVDFITFKGDPLFTDDGG
ncbi:uncharacterized protein LOC143292723 [Babylonia areolata]|uniref:uncharacterized protein LOC143292723 n=1 Tax=Babylonia areolata TaxID=304850 RepID=UPI003FD1FA5E